MKKVEDAIVLAGGLGTRMLPASMYMPKETMPLVDTPLLNHLIWEAAKAGVSRIHLVISPEKFKILEKFFDGDKLFDGNVCCIFSPSRTWRCDVVFAGFDII